MQVGKDVHALRIPFKLEIGPGKTLDRFVYSYLIYGSSIHVIDCGVASSRNAIFEYLKKTGRDPGEICMAVLTHAHPDHMGGALGVKKATGCRIAAHGLDAPWIQDARRQYKERPVPSFDSLIEGSVKVDVILADGDILDLGEGRGLKVIHTPGHSKGHVCFYYETDGALFAGDSIPLTGTLPIYEDAVASIMSIGKLKAIKGLRVLLSSWDEPRVGERIYALIDEGMNYIQQVHETVLKEKRDRPSASSADLTARVLGALGMPAMVVPPIVVKSIEAHLRVADCADLLKGSG